MDILTEVAKREGISRERAESYMQVIIDDMWDQLDDTERKKLSADKPAPDEMLAILADYVKSAFFSQNLDNY